MLYVISGNNRQKARAERDALLEKFLTQGMNEERLREEHMTEGTLRARASARALFGGPYLFVCDEVCGLQGMRDALLASAPDLKQSPNVFLVFEPTLPSSCIKELKDHAEEMYTHALPKEKPDSSIFALSDALGARDKKTLWILFTQAREKGVSSEEIAGTLFWAVKTLALMKTAKEGELMGLNPYTARKARASAKNYSLEEIHALSRELVMLYHRGHEGEESMDVGLERFILNLPAPKK